MAAHCAGLGALLAAHLRFLDARGTLILTGASPSLRRLVQLTALDSVLFLAADIAAATGHQVSVGIEYAYADVVERLGREFTDRTLTVIVDAVHACREQLSCVPESAMPEMLERLARLTRARNGDRSPPSSRASSTVMFPEANARTAPRRVRS